MLRLIYSLAALITQAAMNNAQQTALIEVRVLVFLSDRLRSLYKKVLDY